MHRSVASDPAQEVMVGATGLGATHSSFELVLFKLASGVSLTVGTA